MTRLRKPSSRLSLDPAQYPCLDGVPLPLPPKERQVLALLISASPTVVTKADFARGAWGGQPMSDESLARCIRQLRIRVPGCSDLLEVVYGVGYRLLDFPRTQAASDRS